MRRVAVIGAGMTKFGQHWSRDGISLAVEAGIKALHKAGLHQKDVGALYLGTMSGGLFNNQEHLASKIADFAGFRNIPSVRVESACASGALALRQGYIDVASGLHDAVVVGGVEKMTDLGSYGQTKALSTAASTDWEGVFGATFPAIYALIARLHMHKYKTSEEQMALVAVKNHSNALLNPFAQFHRKISVEDVLSSPKIADPIKLLDSSPITDGAAAVVLASEDVARKASDAPVWIAGSGHATDRISLHDRKDMLSLHATAKAAREAYKQAGLSPKDIGMAEVHDCFTISEILAIEDLGFAEKGEGGKLAEEGQTMIGGAIPVNPSGGLKAKGHPVGASGVAQAVEAFLQLRQEAGKRNTNAETALTHSVGGSGGSAVVHVFRR